MEGNRKNNENGFRRTPQSLISFLHNKEKEIWYKLWEHIYEKRRGEDYERLNKEILLFAWEEINFPKNRGRGRPRKIPPLSNLEKYNSSYMVGDREEEKSPFSPEDSAFMIHHKMLFASMIFPKRGEKKFQKLGQKLFLGVEKEIKSFGRKERRGKVGDLSKIEREDREEDMELPPIDRPGEVYMDSLFPPDVRAERKKAEALLNNEEKPKTPQKPKVFPQLKKEQIVSPPLNMEYILEKKKRVWYPPQFMNYLKYLPINERNKFLYFDEYLEKEEKKPTPPIAKKISKKYYPHLDKMRKMENGERISQNTFESAFSSIEMEKKISREKYLKILWGLKTYNGKKYKKILEKKERKILSRRQNLLPILLKIRRILKIYGKIKRVPFIKAIYKWKKEAIKSLIHRECVSYLFRRKEKKFKFKALLRKDKKKGRIKIIFPPILGKKIGEGRKFYLYKNYTHHKKRTKAKKKAKLLENPPKKRRKWRRRRRKKLIGRGEKGKPHYKWEKFLGREYSPLPLEEEPGNILKKRKLKIRYGRKLLSSKVKILSPGTPIVKSIVSGKRKKILFRIRTPNNWVYAYRLRKNEEGKIFPTWNKIEILPTNRIMSRPSINKSRDFLRLAKFLINKNLNKNRDYFLKKRQNFFRARKNFLSSLSQGEGKNYGITFFKRWWKYRYSTLSLEERGK